MEIITAKEMNELTKKWENNLVKEAVECTIAEFKATAIKGYFAKIVDMPKGVSTLTWANALESLGYKKESVNSTTVKWSW